MKPTAFSLRFCFCILALCVFSVGFSQVDPKPLQVFTQDGISIKSYDYETFKSMLSKPTDTTYVVNFWATWCAPCIAELPNFERLGQTYKGSKLKVVLVSLDSKKQVEKSLIPFVKKKKLQSKVLLLSDPDMNAWIPKVDEAWSGALPATVIYNTSKKHRKFYEQSFSYEQLESEVKPLIR